MRTLLIPLDGSELAERAIVPARRMAAATGAALLLVGVVPQQDGDVLGDGELAAAERYLRGVALSLDGPGRRVSVQVSVGDPAEAVLAQAARRRVSLIVMSTHGRGGLDRVLHGSVADAVVRGAQVPVLLVPSRGGEHPEIAGDAVVVAVDGSAFAETAVARAAETARELAIPLAIVRAVHWEPSVLGGLAPTYTTLGLLEAEARAYVDRLTAEARRAAVDARGDVVVGPAARSILDYAERRNAALLVMATHGRAALSRLTLGSVTTHVLTHTTRPLMVVRPTAVGPDEQRVLVATHAPA